MSIDDLPVGPDMRITFTEGHTADISLEDWLQKYRPSRQGLHNKVAWISVRAQGRPANMKTEEDLPKSDGATAEASAAECASELADKIQKIESDPDIPVRGSKKNGTRSKKEHREDVYKVMATRFKNLAVDSNIVSGKWMFFPLTDNVDTQWFKIAKAIINEDGALRGKVYDAKVSPYEPGEGEKPSTHVICVYVHDSWNQEIVKDAFVTMVKELGLVSGSYKADIYTIAGIDSKHPSKMKSTLYNKSDFMTQEEIDAVFEAKKAPVKTVVKKAAKGAGFVSGSDSDEEPKAKKTKTKM